MFFCFPTGGVGELIDAWYDKQKLTSGIFIINLLAIMEMNPNQPQSQTKVPPPPTPEVSVRTMQSDIKSISQGEVSPTPEIVAPRPSFDNRAAQSFIPETAGQMMSDEEMVPKKSHKGLWVMIIIVIVIALAAVGYFVVYPMMSAPVVTPTAENTQQPIVAPAPPVATHMSAFGNSIPAVSTATLKLDAITRETIIQGLTDQGALLTDGLTEVVIQDATGGQVPFATYLTALLPAFLDGQSASTYATDDFTVYIFKNSSGIWPGYIIPLRPEGSATLAQWLANFEKTDLGALFVTAPGTIGAFKDGTVMGIGDRFAPGTTPGASMSYAATATDLHISTSFDGLKTALSALGY